MKGVALLLCGFLLLSWFLDDFEERLKRIDRADGPALFELAVLCKKKGRKKEYRRVLTLVLEADPDHEKANKALGRVKYKGKWITPEKRKALVAAERAERMKAIGLVEYKGAWVTPEEKAMLEKGLVLHRGKWMTAEEMKAAEGYVREGGEWIKKEDLPSVVEMNKFEKEFGVPTVFFSTAHFAVFSELGDGFNRNLAGRLEKGWEWFEGFSGSKMKTSLLGDRKAHVCVFDRRESYDKYVTCFSRFQENVTEEWTGGARQALGFAWWDPACYSVAYRGPREIVEVSGQILHQIGHVLINRKGYNYHFLPPWLDEGFAALFEQTVTGRNRAFCIEGRNLVSSLHDKQLFSGVGWSGLLSELVVRGDDIPLTELMVKGMDEIDQDDAAKAIGLVRFLGEQGGRKVGVFLATLQRMIPRDMNEWIDPAVVQSQLDAFRAGFATTPEDVDAAFRALWRKGLPGRK